MISFCFCLLLLYTSVSSHPSNYGVSSNENLGFSNDFWSQQFGSDFRDAIHMTLNQPSSENSRKRSAYIVHTPQIDSKHASKNSMKVHLLRPDEMDSLEKQMIGYGSHNKMAGSPVVVNLPGGDAVSTKNDDHEGAFVLKAPAVVYHNNVNNRFQPQYWQTSQKMPSFTDGYPYPEKIIHPQMMPYSYMNQMQSPYGRPMPSFERIQPAHDNDDYFYEKINQPPVHESTPPIYELIKPLLKNDQNSAFEVKEQPKVEVNSQSTKELNETRLEVTQPATTETPVEKIPSYIEKPQPLPKQPTFAEIPSHLEKEQPSPPKQLTLERIPSHLEKEHPSPKIKDSNEGMQVSIVKPKPSLPLPETTEAPIEKSQPTTEKTQPLSEQFDQHLQPYQSLQSFFRKTPYSFQKMHPSFYVDKMQPSYESEKPTSYSSRMYPLYERKTMFPYGDGMFSMFQSQNFPYEPRNQPTIEGMSSRFHEKKPHLPYEGEDDIKNGSPDMVSSA